MLRVCSGLVIARPNGSTYDIVTNVMMGWSIGVVGKAGISVGVQGKGLGEIS